MRKFILIASLVLASAAAHAGPSVQVASNETPAVQTPEAKPESAQPESAQPDAAKPEATKPDAAKPAKTVTRHENREAKARRIAARYGVYW